MKSVLIPGSLDELYELLKELAANKEALSIRGSGASPYSTYGYNRNMIVTSRLNRIKISSRNIIVESGAKLRAVREVLDKEGLYVPLMSLNAEAETIGGMISEDRMIIGYGSIGVDRFIDFLEVSAYGGRGMAYDRKMHHFIGSMGRYGVIARIGLRYFGKNDISSLVLRTSDMDAVIDIATDLCSRGLQPLHLIAISDGECHYLFLEHVNRPSSLSRRISILVDRIEPKYRIYRCDEGEGSKVREFAENFYIETMKKRRVLNHCEVSLKPSSMAIDGLSRYADAYIADLLSRKLYIFLKEAVSTRSLIRYFKDKAKLIKVNIGGRVRYYGSFIKLIRRYKMIYDPLHLYPKV